MPSEQTLSRALAPRYISGWLPAERAAPLLALPVSRRIGETAIASPLTAQQCEQVLDLLAAGAPVRRQAARASELRLTPRRRGYFIALGPLSDAP